MNRQPIIPDVSQWQHYDLMNFNDYRLTGAGELEMSPRPSMDVIMKLGHNVLSMTALTIEDEYTGGDKSSTLYVIRNLTAGSEDAVTTLDDTQQRAGQRFIGDKLMEVYESPSLVIGRAEDATPELQLDTTASRYHTSLRIGALARRMHIADLYSQNGTHLYLNPAVRHGVASPTRRFHVSGGGMDMTTYEQQQGRWSRHEE